MSLTGRTHFPVGMRSAFVAALGLALAATQGAGRAAETPCSARSADHAPAVVELYTSEGCSSCPPAEHWLSNLEGAHDVIALAFHVDYWDSLGWKDRYAQPAFTQRQSSSQRTTGARFAYTPQVIVDGKDTPAWPGLTSAALGASRGAAAPVALQLAAQGHALELTVIPGALAPARMAGYIAVVDDGLTSRPSAGENRGATLQESGVVRELLPWVAVAPTSTTLHFSVSSPPEPGATRRFVAVATTADGARPLQAVALACGR
ncbi:MAG TPA: DUF1223 domain-containing protein [Burkholderiaceae bacterium]|jgi:hypothetical protein|nr:DUF1223 domain-containing protein [Burkholderiaceae bacterium]